MIRYHDLAPADQAEVLAERRTNRMLGTLVLLAAVAWGLIWWVVFG